MASGADNNLILDLWENYTIPATNQSSVHWRLRLVVNYGVNAIMVGQVGLADANGSQVIVWSYTGNPGYLTNGNTYTLAEGDAVLSHNSSGGGVLSGWATLRTNQQGSSWSFNKSATAAINSTPIVRTPGTPRNLRVQSVTRTSVVLAVDDPTDWGNQRVALLYRIGTTNPPQNGTYYDNQGPGNVATFPAAGQPALTPNTTYYAVAYAYNSAGYSSPTSPAISFTTLANGPAYPTSIAVEKAGTDASPTHRVSWVNNATSVAPYDLLGVERQEWVNGSGWGEWATVATFPGTAVAAYIPATTPNRAYRYRIRAQNTGGQSWSASTLTAPTVPLQLLSVTAERGTGGSAVVRWVYPQESLIRMPSLQVVVEELVSGSWVQKAALDASGTTPPTSWTDVSPSGGSVYYRVFLRAQQGWTSNPAVTKYVWTSDGPLSQVALTIESEPAAPTRLVPSSVPIDLARPQSFTWQYNSQDGSPQTSYQVRYRQVGTTEWLTPAPVESSAAVWPYTAGLLANGASYQWQVRTRGECLTCGPDDGWSVWSAASTFTGSYTPVVTINYPVSGSEQSIAQLTATWGFFDADGDTQVRWWATLLGADGQQLETQSGSGPTSSVTFSTLVEDGKSYTVTVQVEDSSGLRSDVASSTFDVRYDPPGIVILDAVWDDASATVGLSMTPTMDGGGSGSVGSLAPDGAVIVDEELDTDGAVLVETDDFDDDGAVLLDLDNSVEPAIAVDVYRSIDGGPWVQLAEQISPSASLVDLYPTMYGCNIYRLVVWSALPSTRVQDPAATVCVGPTRALAGETGIVHKSPEGILSYGTTPDDQLRLCGVGPASETIEREQDAVWVDGAEDPVWLGGTVVEERYELSGTTTQGRRTVEAAARADAPLVWRDITGQKVQVSITGGLTKTWLRENVPGTLQVRGRLLKEGSGDAV